MQCAVTTRKVVMIIIITIITNELSKTIQQCPLSPIFLSIRFKWCINFYIDPAFISIILPLDEFFSYFISISSAELFIDDSTDLFEDDFFNFASCILFTLSIGVLIFCKGLLNLAIKWWLFMNMFLIHWHFVFLWNPHLIQVELGFPGWSMSTKSFH